MRLRHIELFEAIRQTGSLTAAASLLHISQPAASKQLAHAEQLLGFKLFERIKGRLHPTPEALSLAPSVARLNEELTHIQRLSANLKYGQTRLLKIGCTPALGLSLMPQAIKHLKDIHPHSHCELSTQHGTELINALMTQTLDFVVCFNDAEHPGLSQQNIGYTELVYISQQRHDATLTLDSICPKELIALEPSDPAGSALQHVLDQHRIQTNISIQVQTHYMAHALVESGCGDAIIDAMSAYALRRPNVHIHQLSPAIRIPVNVMMQTHKPLGKIYLDLLKILENLMNMTGKV